MASVPYLPAQWRKEMNRKVARMLIRMHADWQDLLRIIQGNPFFQLNNIWRNYMEIELPAVARILICSWMVMQVYICCVGRWSNLVSLFLMAPLFHWQKQRIKEEMKQRRKSTFLWVNPCDQDMQTVRSSTATDGHPQQANPFSNSIKRNESKY